MHHPDGQRSAVIRTGELNIEEVDATRRVAALASFARLCHTLEAPLQLVVRVRPQTADDGTSRGQAGSQVGRAELEGAMREHWAERLRAAPAFRREVLIATRAATADTLRADTHRAMDAVRAMGIAAERLRDEELARAIAAGLHVGAPVEWSLHPQHVAFGDLLVRGFALRRLPSHPVTVGWLAPVLILPRGWQRWPLAQLDAVLTHEAEHARRHDPLVQWLALFNRAVFWFHPLTWWLERRLATLAEEVCDAAVLAAGHSPQDYSDYLLEFARSVTREGRRLHVVAMAMPGSGQPERMRHEPRRTPPCG